MAILRKVKKLRGRKLKTKSSTPELTRMRKHSNELQDKSNEQIGLLNQLVEEVRKLKMRI